MRSVLELAREQRCADEETGERRQPGEDAQRGCPAVELALEVPDDDVAARARRRRQALRERVAVVRRLDRQVRAEHGGGVCGEQAGHSDVLGTDRAPGYS